MARIVGMPGPTTGNGNYGNRPEPIPFLHILLSVITTFAANVGR
jgi:hypothetical protein